MTLKDKREIHKQLRVLTDILNKKDLTYNIEIFNGEEKITRFR